MRKVLSFFTVLFFIVLLPVVGFAVQNMTGTAHVNVTSDTAATAKVMALNEARRQIITDVLSRYADAKEIAILVKDTKDAKLTNIISSTSIDGERQSATIYSANIEMTVDSVSAKQWFNENNVQNWLGEGDSANTDVSMLLIDISDGLRGWVEFGTMIKSSGLYLDVRKISSGQITASIPVGNRTKLLAAVSASGWKYSDMGTFLRIWK